MPLVSILRKIRCKNPSWLVWHISVMDDFPTYRFLLKPVLTRHNRTNLARLEELNDYTPQVKRTVRPWKGTFTKEKDHLPTIHFQGRTVKLRGCNILYKALNSWHVSNVNNLPINCVTTMPAVQQKSRNVCLWNVVQQEGHKEKDVPPEPSQKCLAWETVVTWSFK